MGARSCRQLMHINAFLRLNPLSAQHRVAMQLKALVGEEKRQKNVMALRMHAEVGLLWC